MAQQPIHESQIGDIPASKITGTIDAGSLSGTSVVYGSPGPQLNDVLYFNGTEWTKLWTEDRVWNS